MKIILTCLWNKNGTPAARAFQSKAFLESIKDYQKRISKYIPCEIQVGENLLRNRDRTTTLVWICDRSSKAKNLTSEEIANALDREFNQGAKELWIVIGGANGISDEEITAHRPNLRWSFGALTLPHELAMVVASEQVYRALSILRNHPYHLGH